MVFLQAVEKAIERKTKRGKVVLYNPMWYLGKKRMTKGSLSSAPTGRQQLRQYAGSWAPGTTLSFSRFQLISDRYILLGRNC